MILKKMNNVNQNINMRFKMHYHIKIFHVMVMETQFKFIGTYTTKIEMILTTATPPGG